MFHFIRLAVVFSVVVVFCVGAVVLVRAIDCTEDAIRQCKQDNDPKLCISELESVCKQKINESVGQQKTLSSTIAYLNTRIRLTQTQITQTQIDIATLEKLINELKTRIDGLELSLQRLTEVLISRIQDSYVHRTKLKDSVLLLFSSNELTQFFTQLKYIQLSQEYTQNLIQQAESQKVTFNNEKQLKESNIALLAREQQLKAANNELQESRMDIAENIEKLKKANSSMRGRELRIIEIKKKVKLLEEKLREKGA